MFLNVMPHCYQGGEAAPCKDSLIEMDRNEIYYEDSK